MILVKELINQSEIVATIHSIASASWAENSEITVDDYTEATLSRCVSNKDQIFCTATVEGEFAGMASAFVLHKPDGDVMLYIDEVDVCANMQRKGVGTEIMKFLINWGEENGCDDCWLGTEKYNVAANALYKSLQPKEIEDFIGYLF